VLIVRARVHDVRPLLDALHRAGLDPSWDWERVDSALALEAALERGPWDVVVHSTTPGLTPEQVAALVGTRAPIVTVTRIDQLAASVRGVLPAD
jgi:hypothetical protein